ncbi:MAG: PEP-CTERM sorting domain-containing protein [Proteobacteria bacterium]|nr:PEP-CTERM sorting domain-containing protein [Pseudomonadota bacterium]
MNSKCFKSALWLVASVYCVITVPAWGDPANAVPEPATIVPIVIGLISLVVLRRYLARRR